MFLLWCHVLKITCFRAQDQHVVKEAIFSNGCLTCKWDHFSFFLCSHQVSSHSVSKIIRSYLHMMPSCILCPPCHPVWQRTGIFHPEKKDVAFSFLRTVLLFLISLQQHAVIKCLIHVVLKYQDFALSHNRNMDLLEGVAPRFGKYVSLPGSRVQKYTQQLKRIKLTYLIWFVNFSTQSVTLF